MSDTKENMARSLPPVTVEVVKDGYRLTCAALGISLVADSVEQGHTAMAELTEGIYADQYRVKVAAAAAAAEAQAAAAVDARAAAVEAHAEAAAAEAAAEAEAAEAAAEAEAAEAAAEAEAAGSLEEQANAHVRPGADAANGPRATGVGATHTFSAADQRVAWMPAAPATRDRSQRRQNLYDAALALGLVVAVAIAIPLVLLLSEVAGLVQAVRQLPQVVVDAGEVQGGLPRALSDALARASTTAQQVTPERKEKMEADVRAIVELLEPLASEIRPLMEGVGVAQSCAPTGSQFVPRVDQANSGEDVGK